MKKIDSFEGKKVKAKFTFIGKQKNKDLWKVGEIVRCYPAFVLVKFLNYQKCFAYDEIEEVNEIEYDLLSSQNEVKQMLINASLS